MNSSAPILAVTFDVGGTLIEPDPSVGHVYATVAARHGVVLPPEILNQRFVAAWRAKRDFAHSRTDWTELVDATFAGLTEVPPSQTFFSELYDEFAAPSAWRIYEDVLPTLKFLHRRGVKLGIISNWDEHLSPLLRMLELDGWFDAIGVSVELGRAKPHREIFQRIAAQLQVGTNSVLHIGDSRAEDVDGARAAGFRALLIRRGTPPVPGEAISALTELEPLL